MMRFDGPHLTIGYTFAGDDNITIFNAINSTLSSGLLMHTHLKGWCRIDAR